MDKMHARPSSSPTGSPALASNWRTILAVDLLLGFATVVVGAILAIGSNRPAGVGLALLGTTYTTMVALRARRWARTRREAAVGDGPPGGD